MSGIQTNPPSAQEKCSIHEQDTVLVPLSEDEVLIPGIADKHPRDMPEMAFVIAFCIQYNEAVGNLNFLPEELEDAIARREPVDLVERIHRYFLRNVLNFPKIIDKRYWIRKLREYLHERIEEKEFIFAYNPFDRIKKNKYHDLSNFEKDLVMWQLKGSEKIQDMWQSRESESALCQDTENVVRPVEIEVLGVDSRGSTYFYLGVGARIYREILSADDTQQCIWEVLTTTLQDIKNLVSDRVEIDPDRSEEERLLYKRISKELISDVEYQIKSAAEEAARKQRGKNSPENVLPSTDNENNINVEPALSVSMCSQTANTSQHEDKGATSSSIPKKNHQSAPKNAILQKRRKADDDDESNKRVKFRPNDDDVIFLESNTTRRLKKAKGKGVLRNGNLELQNTDVVNSDAVSKNKGKGILRDGGPSQITEGSTADVTNLSVQGIFIPGPEELIKLEWSLNHVFFEELEIFGGDSDSELSECCDACIMEVDRLLAH